MKDSLNNKWWDLKKEKIMTKIPTKMQLKRLAIRKMKLNDDFYFEI